MFNTNGQQNMSLDLSFQIQNFGSTLPSSTRFYFGTDPITQNSSVNNAYIDVEICQSYLLKGSTGNSCLDAKCDSYAGARLAVSVTSIFIAGFSILGEFCLVRN